MTFRNICFGYGGKLLLNQVDLNIKFGDKICLIGRNGVGKTTLMGIIAGQIEPDSGDIWSSGTVDKSYLAQSVPSNIDVDALHVICGGLGDMGEAILMSYSLENNTLSHYEISTAKHAYLQKLFDTNDGWVVRNRIEKIISQMKLPVDVPFNKFSTGMQRRVLLARAIVVKSDLLILDEPTNHMDLDSIFWLETFLLKFKKTLLFTTHDRALIRALATRIVEIDRGRVVSWECKYDTYMKRKQECILAQAREEDRFDKKLLAEESWAKKGIKARRTRDEGRIRELQKSRKIRQQRQDKIGSAKVQIDEGDLGGKLVIEANNITFSYDRKVIIKKLSCKIIKGDRIGIVGPNGCGKTTLVNLFLRRIKPDIGLIRHGARVKVAYFDQCRVEIDYEKSARENVFDGNDFFKILGRWRHTVGYLKDFLFSPERSSVPTKVLSGGEKNRLLLAKLFAKPANFLVLDEPTNDLDIETLELLEKLLISYKGTIFLVSHDRTFIKNVATTMFFFRGDCEVDVFVGNCVEAYNKKLCVSKNKIKAKASKKLQKINIAEKDVSRKTKISYKEKCELESLPDLIESLEKRMEELYETMSSSDFYRQGSSQILNSKNELTKTQEMLETAYTRWESLELLV